jgi:hypothetical protein
MKTICIILIMFIGTKAWCQNSGNGISGIWIPESVHWQKNGDFKTYFFENDSEVVIISSVQKKVKDSIYFNVEEGYNLFHGYIKLSGVHKVIQTKMIYRFVKLTGFNYDTSFLDSLSIRKTDGHLMLLINHIPYCRGVRYNAASKQEIFDIATKTVPKIEADPDKYH